MPKGDAPAKSPLDRAALDQLFVKARSFNRYTERPVADQTLRDLYDLLKWGPTSQNMQPARYVFVRTPEGKRKLASAVMAGNAAKVDSAPVTAIVAIDERFYEHLPSQFKPYNARSTYENNEELAALVALRNGTLQGAYLMLAARALGLDCGAMSGFDIPRVNAMFLPDGRWHANFLVSLGYGDPAGNYPASPRLDFEDVARFA